MYLIDFGAEYPISWIGCVYMTGRLAVKLWQPLLFIAVVSYFLGCFNGAVIVSKYILRDDVRNHGSGNAGLTNFHRTFGGGLTFVVILCDVLKAVAALLIAVAVSKNQHVVDILIPIDDFWLTCALPPVVAKYWAALFCLLGHMFPCMFHFKGGKGILSGGTIALMIDWRVALVVWGGFLVLVILTRYVSLGSVWAGASFPVATWFAFQNAYGLFRWIMFALALILGGLVVWQHRGNIKRLLSGTESKFSLHKKK